MKTTQTTFAADWAAEPTATEAADAEVTYDNNAEYRAACDAHTVASRAYRAACEAYRSRSIGDAEFLLAKAAFKEADAAFDAAFSKVANG